MKKKVISNLYYKSYNFLINNLKDTDYSLWDSLFANFARFSRDFC